MDALARLRRSQGKPACAVILPMVLGVGVVAENLDLENSLTRKGMYGIDEEALLDAFEVSILEQQRPQHDGASFDHLVVGLDPAELHRARRQADGDVDAFWAADQRFSILLDSMNQLDGANQGDGEAQFYPGLRLPTHQRKPLPWCATISSPSWPGCFFST
ncbi:hypothetical protein AU210_008924 [Fusarium oxysporum f. sp. radicis-cucumerinum]|uniref:Uncharacterized protein n=2 Tax=Fusarium oxysporum TaxID=5507 RepID=A0A2H3GS03_FUSOX|nr:hypothetical protein AU210_008924 [Fusarium oxysporum f. sp. radicis-cucumerinum]RKK52094.1 hypothetical protein BFJ67_g5773 [Fusarium oxysporum f. sp. cepae]